jgi:GNAT superfamily N-acetyltransferase
MNKTSVRQAAVSDVDALCELYLEFHEFHTRHLPDQLRRLEKASPEEHEDLCNNIIEIMHAHDTAILVAEHADRVIGFAEIHLKHPDPSNQAVVAKTTLHVQSLYVTASCRRTGIGGELLQAAEDWGHVRQAVEIRLDTWEFTSGPHAFYEKQGYHTLRRTLVKKI